MNKIVIIGASTFGHSVAVRLREQNNSCAITLISDENYPAYDRSRLADFLSGSIKEEDLFFCKEEFYQQNNINFMKGREIASLNTDKRLAYFKDKGNIEYVFLIIASGRSPELPDIPGAKKEGVYSFYSLDEIKKFLKQFIAHPVCLVGSDNSTLNIAKVISEKYKTEVKLISRNSFDASLIAPNVEVINSSLQEIIGEGETQAIKLKEGKVIAACAVLFMDYYKSNIDFLKNTKIEVQNDFIVVDASMRTNIENIFSVGSVTNRIDLNDSTILVDNLIKKMKGEICQTF